MRMVTCSKLKKELEGVERPTYPGELGKKVFDSVSKEAWALWLKHMTMLINEYRLTPIEPKARTFLEEEMEKFFFGEGSETPKERRHQEPLDSNEHSSKNLMYSLALFPLSRVSNSSTLKKHFQIVG